MRYAQTKFAWRQKNSLFTGQNGHLSRNDPSGYLSTLATTDSPMSTSMANSHEALLRVSARFAGLGGATLYCVNGR